jgi:hypothetical protein
VKVAIEILAEETKLPPQDALKYIDRSFLQQALKELKELKELMCSHKPRYAVFAINDWRI